MRHRLPHIRVSSVVSRIPATRPSGRTPPAIPEAARRAVEQSTRSGGRLVGPLGRSIESVVDRFFRLAGRRSFTSQAQPTAPLLLTGGPEAVVPEVRGSSEDEAVERLVAAGLVVERLGADRSDGPPTGCVLRTKPPAGAVVAAGATVGYVVASPLWPAPETLAPDPGHIDPDAFMSLMRAWSRRTGVYES